MINEFVSLVNNILWGDGQVLIIMLLACGIWFTVKLGGVQLRHFGHMFSLLKGSNTSTKDGISSFQALCTSLSARVGTGNLAGVAVAISLGGAGAIFLDVDDCPFRYGHWLCRKCTRSAIQGP